MPDQTLLHAVTIKGLGLEEWGASAEWPLPDRGAARGAEGREAGRGAGAVNLANRTSVPREGLPLPLLDEVMNLADDASPVGLLENRSFRRRIPAKNARRGTHGDEPGELKHSRTITFAHVAARNEGR